LIFPLLNNTSLLANFSPSRHAITPQHPKSTTNGYPTKLKISNHQFAHHNAQSSEQQALTTSFEELNNALRQIIVRKELPTCPYHRAIVDMVPNSHYHDTSPMSRFLEESAYEQSSLFIRNDTGKPSTARFCTCLVNMEARQ